MKKPVQQKRQQSEEEGTAEPPQLVDGCPRNGTVLIHKFSSFKGNVQPDKICIRVVSLDRPRKGCQPFQVFDFYLFFELEFLKRLQSSERINAKMTLISSFFGSRLVENPFFLFAGALLFDEKNPP